MRLSIDVDRTSLPLSFRHRIAFRNSRIRMEVAGYANYERIRALGFDVTVQWSGAIDATKPAWSYRKKRTPQAVPAGSQATA